MTVRSVGAVFAVACASLLAACGLGDKAALEDLITGAPARLEATTVTGTVRVETRLLDAPDLAALGPDTAGFGIGAPGLPSAEPVEFEIPDEGIPFGSTHVAFAMDLDESRVTLRLAPEADPVVYVEDLVYFGRRSGVPADDARPWVRLPLEDLSDGAGEVDPLGDEATTSVVAAHLAVITDLVAGTLTGSIETVGPETIDGVQTTHYDVNVALDKTFGDTRRSRYPEDRRETVERMLELLGIDGNVHPADVWLDAEGNLRRFSVALRQKPLPKTTFAMIVTVDYEVSAADYTVDLPSPQEVLGVESVVRFIRTVMRDPADDTDEVPPALAATLVDNGSGDGS